MTNSATLDYYSTHGPMTDPCDHAATFFDLPRTVPELCRVVQGLLMHKFAGHLYGISITRARQREENIRPVAAKLEAIRARDSRSLLVAREPRERLVGNCRDFTLLLVSMLRHNGVPARGRCGFGAYLGNGAMNYDHWVAEYWNNAQGRWVLVDA